MEFGRDLAPREDSLASAWPHEMSHAPLLTTKEPKGPRIALIRGEMTVVEWDIVREKERYKWQI